MATVVKSPCSVVEVTRHDSSLMTVTLKPIKRLPKYRAGQFMHLSLDHYDPSRAWPESRVFSIANFDPHSASLKITFSVKGDYTKRMYDEITDDTIVWIKMPYGDFTFEPQSSRVVLVAGGTGVTPFVAFLEEMVANINIYQKDLKIELHYGARSRELLIWWDHLIALQKNLPNLSIIGYVEKGLPSSELRTGTMIIDEIYRDHQDFKTDYYICGPEAMIRTFSNCLRENHVDTRKIHLDKWE